MKTAFFPGKMLSSQPANTLEAWDALCTEFERFGGHAGQMPELSQILWAGELPAERAT